MLPKLKRYYLLCLTGLTIGKNSKQKYQETNFLVKPWIKFNSKHILVIVVALATNQTLSNFKNTQSERRESLDISIRGF